MSLNPHHFGPRQPPRDGTEGTATITLTLEDEHDKDTKTQSTRYNGCIIGNNDGIKNFFGDFEGEPEHFFIYFYLKGRRPQNWRNRFRQCEIKVHRFTKPKKPAVCKIRNKGDILEIGDHLFLPVKAKMFEVQGPNEFREFLRKYCKRIAYPNFQVMQALSDERNIAAGLKLKSEQPGVAMFFGISRIFENDKLWIRNELFSQLVEGPMLIGGEVVGWCFKENSPEKITLHTFVKPKEPIYIWKKSSQPPAPPPAPDRYHDDVDTANPGLLKDLLQQNLAVGSCLNGLDCEYRVLNNWKHLADRLEAPLEVKLDCKSVTKHSPTLVVLQRPDVSEIACTQFMDEIKDLRKDVYDVLKDGIPEDERGLSLKDALLSKDELVDNVARRLDAKPVSSATKNWKYYGKKLKIPDDELDLIERDGKNSAEKLLLYVYKTLRKEQRTAGKFREIIMGFKNRVDLQKFVNDHLKIKENDHRPLEDILPPDSNEMKEATALLNKDCKGTLSNWKHLAKAWGISYEIYHDFDHENIPGPTKKLMEWVCTSNHQVSVQQFLNILGDLPRYDIREALEKIISKQ